MPEDLTTGDQQSATAAQDPAGARRRRRPPTLGIVAGATVAALLLGGAALGLAIARSGAGSPRAVVTCSPSTPRLTVKGVGQATATPDLLTAAMQIDTTAGTAAASLSENNAKVAAVVTALAQAGVAPADQQTTGLTLQPQFAYPHGVQTVIGYQVSNTVTAKLHDIGTAGAAIDSVVGAAGNALQIESLTFSFNHPAVVEDQARASAVRQAVSHARTMAQAAGRRLGPVCSLTDETQSQTVPEPFQNYADAGTSAAASVPIQAGTQSESDQVTMVYAVGS